MGYLEWCGGLIGTTAAAARAFKASLAERSRRLSGMLAFARHRAGYRCPPVEQLSQRRDVQRDSVVGCRRTRSSGIIARVTILDIRALTFRRRLGVCLCAVLLAWACAATKQGSGMRPPEAASSRQPATSVALVPQRGHSEEIRAAVLALDDRLLVSTSGDRSFAVWDVKTGTQIKTVPSDSGPVGALAVLPDGRRLLVGADDVRLWTLDQLRPVATFRDPHGSNATPYWERSMTLSAAADGASFVWRNSKGATEFDLHTGAHRWSQPFTGTLDYDRSFPAVFSQDGRFAILGDSDQHATNLVRVDGGEQLLRVESHRGQAWGAFGYEAQSALSADGRVLAVLGPEPGGADGRFTSRGSSVEVWDVPARRHLASFRRGRDECEEVSFMFVFMSASGRLAVSPGPRSLLLWEPRTGNVLAQLGGCDIVSGGAFSPDEQHVFVEYEHRLELWHIPSATRLRTWDDSCKVQSFSRSGLRAIVSCWSGSLELVDLASGRRIQTFESRTNALHTVAASERTQLLATGEPRAITLWNLATLGVHRALAKPNESLAFSPDGRLLAAASSSGELGVWQTDSGRLLRERAGKPPFGASVAIAFAPDGRRLVVGATDPTFDIQGVVMPFGDRMRLWDLARDAFFWELPHDTDAAMTIWMNGALAFTPDGQHIVGASEDWSVGTWSAKTGAIEGRLNLDPDRLERAKGIRDFEDTITAFALSPDGTRVIVGRGGRVTGLYDLATAAPLASVGSGRDGSWATAAAFSRDGKGALLGHVDGSVTHWVFNGPAHVMKRHSGTVTSVVFVNDTHATSTSKDGTTRLWRLDTGYSVALVTQGEDWVVYDDDGNFDASRNGSSLVAAVSGYRPFRIDQLAARNNRPDVLLERIGLGNPGLIAHYRARHLLRLSKLGLDEHAVVGAFEQAPTAQIEELRSDGQHATLRLRLQAHSAPLSRYQLFVNDVPIFGKSEKTVSGRAQQIQETLELSGGRNKIEVSVRDAAGVESLRDFRVVESAPRKGDLYFIGFGVSRYANPKYNLGYPAKDANDLGEIFRAMKGTSFRDVRVATFVDDRATTEAMRNAKALLANAKVDDTVVVFIAGHGLHAGDVTASFYFATYETNVSKLSTTAASFELLEDMLDGIAPRRKLLLLDTCESGDRRDVEVLPLLSADRTRGMRARTMRGLTLELRRTQPQSITDPFTQRERFIYNDLRRRTGTIVFSSSRGNEYSYERDDWQNGAFTAELKLALTTPRADLDGDAWVTTTELRRYVSQAVADRTNGAQNPTVDRDNLEAAFGFPTR